jgi:ubiquinone/menaquinone biosynthesis C-methylase UbiE
MVSLLTEDINEYLKYDEVIDFDKPEIKALADTLFDEVSSETDYVRHAFEYVRDTYPHSADINADEIAVSASDVLKIGHGICHAKSHLLAALLRCKGVPAGLCYQKLILDDETNPVYICHGLIGVYLNEFNKWIRLDPRGNRSDVDAQFSIDEEKLAFPVRVDKGEEDDLTVYPDPKAFVIKSMRESKTRTELWINLPAATSIESTRHGFEESFAAGTFYNRQTQDSEHLNKILEFVKISEGMRILDLGTGSGYLSFPIAKNNPGCEVVGLDIVNDALETNRMRADSEGIKNLSFISYDGIDFPFEEKSFDLVVTRYALHHFPDIEHSIGEVSRVLKSDGMLFISDPCPNECDTERFVDDYMRLKKDGHIKFYTKDQWIDICGRQGLIVTDSFDSSIRFPKKKDTANGYEEVLKKHDKAVIESYDLLETDTELFITEQVNNIMFEKELREDEQI